MVVIATGAVALLVVASGGRVWRVARNVVTIAHEGGHALAALLSGRQLSGIRLHSDTSGVTVSRGRPDGIGMIVTILAGYTAPAVVGLAGIILLTTGRITGLLWISILLLAAMLLLIRNVYGVVAVVGTGAVVFAVSWWTPSAVQSSSPTCSPGSCCSPACVPCSNCSPSAAAIRPRTRTPTSWPG